MDENLKKKINIELKKNKVCLFMKGTPDVPQCGFSLAVANVLKHLGVAFKGINVLEDAELRGGIKEFSDWPTIPQLYIEEEFIGGCDIVKEMFENGDLQKKLGIKFKKHTLLITINSFIEKKVTLELFLENIFKALEKFQEATKIFTLPNSDINSNLIKKEVIKFCKRNPNSFYFKSLGSLNYLSCMKISDLVIGNSSSGIIEAPSLKIPTINIGNRQEGRVKSPSIINIDHSQKQIYLSIKKCLSISFKKRITKIQNPYFKKNTALKITNIIKKKILNKKDITKNFYDVIKK